MDSAQLRDDLTRFVNDKKTSTKIKALVERFQVFYGKGTERVVIQWIEEKVSRKEVEVVDKGTSVKRVCEHIMLDSERVIAPVKKLDSNKSWSAKDFVVNGN